MSLAVPAKGEMEFSFRASPRSIADASPPLVGVFRPVGTLASALVASAVLHLHV